MRFVGNTLLDKLFLERNVTYLVKALGCAYGGSVTNMAMHLVVKISEMLIT